MNTTKIKKSIILSTSAVFLSMFAIAPMLSANEKDSIQHHSLNEVHINAVRVSDDSPFAHQDVDQETIERNNTGRDLPYLLNMTPSLIVNSDAGAGVGYTGLRIRGSDLGRINFTINGMPVNDPESQIVMFVNFPDLLSSTSSIQIQRGVGSSTNGGGVFGASIHVNNAEQSLLPQAEINNTFGSFNTWKHTVKVGSGMLKNGFQFDVRASKISSDGYINRATSDLKSLHFITGWTSENQKTSIKFNMLTGKEKTYQAWNGIDEQQLKDNRRFNPVGQKEDGTFYDDQTDNYQQDFYQLLFNHQFNRHWKANAGLFLTRGRGYYNEYRIKDKLSSYGMPAFSPSENESWDRANLVRQRWLDNYYYGGTYALEYTKGSSKLLLGGSISQYDGDHYGFVKWAEYGIPVDHQWYLNTSTKKDVNTYIKYEQKLGRQFVGFAELQHRWVDYEMNGFRSAPDMNPHANYNFINPKLGLSFHEYHKNGSLSKAYFSFAIANKEPNRKDFEESPIYWADPEELYDFELGYEWMSQKLTVGANLFYMHYINQLILSGKINEYGVYGRINVDKSYRRGIELTANYQPVPALNISGNLSLSQNHIIDFEEYIDDYDDGGQIMNYFEKTDISFSPSAISSLVLRWNPFLNTKKMESLFVQGHFKYVGRQYLDNTTNKDRSINPYETLDLLLGYKIPNRWNKHIALSLALNNVMNKMYEANGYSFSYKTGGEIVAENYYFPQAGFNFMLGLSLKF